MAAFILPAIVKPLNRGEPVLRIHFHPNATVVTLREDGVVSFWTPRLYLKNKKNVFVGYFHILPGFFLCVYFKCNAFIYFYESPILFEYFSISLCSLTDPLVENQNGLLILCQCQSIKN